MENGRTGFLQGKLLPALTKFSSNKYLIALRDGITAVMPFTIIGSLFLLITNLPIKAWKEWIAPYAPTLNIVYSVCMNYMALVVVVSVTYQLAKELKINRLFTAFFALISFIMSCTTAENGLNTGYFGSVGIFPAIVIAIVTCKIVELFTKYNIGIKMPKGVPQMVSDSFNSLISGGTVIVFFWLITAVLKVDLNVILSKILSPLITGLDTLPGCLLVVFISTFIWCCGINEAAISGVTYTVWYTLLAENTAAFLANEPIPHFAAYGFQYFGMWLTGTGVTGGLVYLMLRSKAKMYRSLGKISLVPAIFNINEPVAFGFPIVFNPIMMIPYIGVSLILTAASYLLTQIGPIGPVVSGCPWTMPPILSGWILSGGDWRNCVWQVICLVISVLVYLPFFKYSEKQKLAKEAAEEAAEAK